MQALKRASVIAGLLVVSGCCAFAVVFIFFYRYIPPQWIPVGVERHMVIARQHGVKVGDRRDEVLRAFSDAWYHKTCIDPEDRLNGRRI